MKQRKSTLAIIGALLLVIVTVFTLTASATDSEYTGTPERMYELIAEYDRSNSEKVRLKSLDKAIAYLDTIDPEEEKIEEIKMGLDLRILDLAEYYLDGIINTESVGDKHSKRDALDSYLASHPRFFESDKNNDFLLKLSGVTQKIANGYIAELGKVDTPDGKHEIIDALLRLSESYSVTLGEEEVAILNSETFLTAKLYLEKLGKAEGVSSRGALLRIIEAFISDHGIVCEEDELDLFLGELDSERREYLLGMNEAMSRLDSLAHVKDLTAPVRIDLTFDEKGMGQLAPMGNTVSGETVAFVGEDFGSDGENKYYTVSFDKEKTHVRTSMDLTAVSNSVVIEFDLTTFDRLPDRNIWVEDVGRANGTSWSIMYFSITPDGHLASDGSGENIILENAITPGKWTHVSLVVEHSTSRVRLYVDYDLVYETNKSHPTLGYTYPPEILIIGANPTTAGGSFSLDNVKVYEGHSPRDISRYTSLTPEQLFILEVMATENNELDPKARKEYYDEAMRNLPLFYLSGEYLTEDEEVIAAIDELLQFDFDGLRTELADYNLAKYTTLYEKLRAQAPGEETLSIRAYWLETIDTYYGTLGGIITSNDSYREMASYVSDERYRIDIEKLALEFVSHVNAFYSASTVSLKKASCESALNLIDSIDREIINSEELYPEFYSALERSLEMETILYESICIDNSKKLLACVTYVMQEAPTEADWDAKYDKLARYVAEARAIIKGGDVDLYYRDLYSVLEDFEPMMNYYFARLQNYHLAYITSELERYEASEQFFERVGILTKLRDYVNEEDIDLEREDIAALVKRIDDELALVMEDEDEYEALLEENTARFVEICEGLVGSVDYATMKKIVSEASEYYYTMKVDIASVQDAIAIYVVRRNEIKAKEELASTFSMLVDIVDPASEDALSGIITSFEYLGALDRDVPGVSSSISSLMSKMAEYDSAVKEINEEILSTAAASVYARNTDGMGSFVTLMLKALED